MFRFMLLAALAVAACRPTTAEIRCGKTECSANQRCEQKLLICVLDEAPSLVIDEPRSGSLIAGDTLIVNGSVRDDNGPASLDLSIDDGKTWSQVVLSGEHFTARVALPTADFQPLGLSLRAHDSLQQATTKRVGLTVDNVPPLLAVASPAEKATLNLAWFAAGKVSGLVGDGSGLATFSVDLGDGDHPVMPGGGQFELAWPAPAGEDAVTHKVRVTAIDLAGNRTVVERTVVVDVVAPVVSFAVPGPDAVLGRSFFLGGGLLQGAVSEGAKVTAQLGNAAAQAASVDKGQWSIAYLPPAGADCVVQQLVVVAVDAAGNGGRAVRTVTVDVVPPVLTFTSPAPGARLNAASFPIGDEVAVGWTVADGDPQVAVRDGMGRVAAPVLKVLTAKTDNPRSYVVNLTAQDRAGNSSQAQLSFAVDRVAPVVTARTPGHEARNTAATAAIEFSEEVTGGAGLTLAPVAGAGIWTTPKRFEVTGLTPDSVYSFAAGAVADGFGNPVVVPAPLKFHTAAAMPASGSTLMTDVARFKLAADADGVMTFFTTSPISPTTPPGYRWARVNPKTGLIEDNRQAWAPVLGGDFAEITAAAGSSVNADLSSHRVSAATTFLSSIISERHGLVRVDDAACSDSMGVVGVIAARPFAWEGSGVDDVGYLRLSQGAVWYSRAGQFPLAVSMSPTAVGVAGTHWDLLEVRNQVLKHRSYGCSAALQNVAPTCGLSAITQLSDVASDDATSFAISDMCSLYAYNNNSGGRVLRAKPYQECAGRTCPAPLTTNGLVWEELRVASADPSKNSFIAAKRIAGDKVQMMRLLLNGDCQGSFVTVGAAITVAPGAAFEPVSLAGKPALVYVDTGNLLKVEVP